ncbi:MAG: hypothetical protein M1822_008960 [Bathelium mastoideum]|nr:MAG: hypothetical protein M1822_008960 [Bathelium mastoideum]
MPSFLASVKNGLWGFVSPRRTQERRDKPFKAPIARSTNAADRRRSMSPVDRVRNWRNSSPKAIPRSPDVPRTPIASGSAGQAGADATPPSVYLNGSTLMDVGEDAFAHNLRSDGRDGSGDNVKSEEASSSQSSFYDDTVLDDTINDNGLEQPTEKYDELEALKRKQAENELYVRRRRALLKGRLEAKGWTQAEIELYISLELRGYLPLLPASWEMDFSTFPTTLFIKEEEKAYIRALGRSGRLSVGSSEFRAQKALQDLVSLGAKVRDTVVVGVKQPEPIAKKQVKKYIKWALSDAGLNKRKGAEELVVVEARVGKEAPQTVQERMLEKLKELAEKHGNLIDRGTDLPALYGILFFHTVMAIVTYDPNTATGDGSKDIRTIASFNFKRLDYDVWNGLSVAIVAMHAREQMQKLYGDDEMMDDEMAHVAA